jgi:hypothetical protein
MEECFMCMYTLICNFIDKFQLKGLQFLFKQSYCDKQLHVTNVFQRIIASFLFASIFQHNDILKCEPFLITHFDH